MSRLHPSNLFTLLNPTTVALHRTATNSVLQLCHESELVLVINLQFSLPPLKSLSQMQNVFLWHHFSSFEKHWCIWLQSSWLVLQGQPPSIWWGLWILWPSKISKPEQHSRERICAVLSNIATATKSVLVQKQLMYDPRLTSQGI